MNENMFDTQLSLSESEIYNWLRDDESRGIFREYYKRLKLLRDTNIAKMDKLLPHLQDNKFVLYGFGKKGHQYLQDITRLGIADNCVEIWDANPQVVGGDTAGIHVSTPMQSKIKNAKVLITVQSLSVIAGMKDHLKKLGITEYLVLDSTSDDFLSKYRRLWSNRKSSQAQYFDPEIILPNLHENEVLIDGGSFDFASSLAFLSKAHNPKKIFAFEPSLSNLSRCNAGIANCGFKNVKLITAAIWKCADTLRFETTPHTGYGDSIKEDAVDNFIEVKAVALDEVIPKEEVVTYIKFDIEGAELEGLIGAKGIIQRDKPKLAISIYHNPDDFIEIPKLIKSFMPEYKAYFRHEQEDQCETVLYCVLKG